MSKERMVAFFDATLAIIMTILVLEMDAPDDPSLMALWQMRHSFLSYALSFFWIGHLWISQVLIWNGVEKANTACLWWTLVLLFCTSFIPFATSYVNKHPDATMPAVFYILVTALIMLASLMLNKEMYLANQENTQLEADYLARRKMLRIVLLLKLAGLIMAFFLPRYALLFVLASLIYLIFARMIHKKKQTV